MPDQDNKHALAPGTELMRHRIERVLGQGGFGITYLALDLDLHRQVALKEYFPADIAVRDSGASVSAASGTLGEHFQWGLDRFLLEARTLASLEHPNIVRVLRYFEANSSAYMVMAYEQGRSLQQVLHPRGTLDEAALLELLLPLIDGLDHVHAGGFLHRDIKPANILMREHGAPVLLDFGAARQTLGARTQTLTRLVSPGYSALEQYLDDTGQQGPWTDIYALAATAYRALCGFAPMDAVARGHALMDDSGNAFMPAAVIGQGRYSPALLEAIDHGMQLRARDRPQDLALWRAQLLGEAAVPADPQAEVVTRRAAPTLAGGPPQVSAATVGAPRSEATAAAGRGAWLLAAGLAAVFIVLGIVLWPAPPGPVSEHPDGESTLQAPVQEGTASGEADQQTAAVAGASTPGAPTAADRVNAGVGGVGDAARSSSPGTPTADAAAAPASGPIAGGGAPAGVQQPAGRRESAASGSTATGPVPLEPSPALERRSAADESTAGTPAAVPDLVPAPAAAATAAGAPARSTPPGAVNGKPAPVSESTPAGPGESAALPGIADAGTGDAAAASGAGAAEDPAGVLEARVHALLDRARKDISARRLTTPTGNNAAERYRRVLELDPGNRQAREGLARVVGAYLSLARDAAAAGRFQQAVEFLDRAASVSAQDPRIAAARRSLRERRRGGAPAPGGSGAGLAPEPQRPAPRADAHAQQARELQARIEALLTKAEEALGSGDRDLALARFEVVLTLDPDNARALAGRDRARALKVPGEVFNDALASGGQGPAMVVIPAGAFEMGTASATGRAQEAPRHRVDIARPFALGRTEITVADFRRFTAATGYRTEAQAAGGCFYLREGEWIRDPERHWQSPGFTQTARMPAVCLSWNDARAYTRWLSRETGAVYRLPSEAQWEYAARAGTQGSYYWGNDQSMTCRYANVSDQSREGSFPCNDGFAFTAGAAALLPNAFGLYDMLGNVWEWTRDCWHDDYRGAPGDGSAWTDGDCSKHSVRGGSWRSKPGPVRAARRTWAPADDRSDEFGFRVMRELE